MSTVAITMTAHMKFRDFWLRHSRLTLLASAVVAACLTLLFSSTSTSPLYLGYKYDAIDVDSNFFMYAGKLILEGKTPYIDFYDHKGLYCFYINALGMAIGGRYGVFFVQCVLATITVYFIGRAVQELHFGWKGVIFAEALYFFAMIINRAGNHTGELLMPFIALPYFFYARALTNNDEKAFWWGNFFAGLSVGMAFNSRPSDAMWGLALVIYYLIHCIKERKPLNLLWNALGAIGGMLIPYLIVIPLALSGGYLETMLKAVFVQNIIYVGDDHSSDWLRYLMRGAVLLWTAAAIGFYFAQRKSRPQLALFLLINTIVGGLFNLLIARYTHYWLSGYPYMIIDLVCFFFVLKPFKKSNKNILKPATIAFAVIGLCWGVGLAGLYYTIGYEDSSYATSQMVYEDIATTIPEEDRHEEGMVYGIDANVAIYLDGDITTNEKYYTFQHWWSADNDEVITEVTSYLSGEIAGKAQPKWLIVGKDNGAAVDFTDVIDLYYGKVTFADAHVNLVIDIYELKTA
jgi:hypothetical protein